MQQFKTKDQVKQDIYKDFKKLPNLFYQQNLDLWNKILSTAHNLIPELKESQEFEIFSSSFMPVGINLKSAYDNKFIEMSNKIYQLEQQLEAKDLIITEAYQRLESLEVK